LSEESEWRCIYVFEWEEWTVMYYMCLSEESERWCIYVLFTLLTQTHIYITVHSPHCPKHIYTSPFTLLTQTHIIHHRSLSSGEEREGWCICVCEWGEWTVMYICVWGRRVNGDVYMCLSEESERWCIICVWGSEESEWWCPLLTQTHIYITVHSPHLNTYNTSPFTLLTQAHIYIIIHSLHCPKHI
jgi:hypothetical protein